MDGLKFNYAILVWIEAKKKPRSVKRGFSIGFGDVLFDADSSAAGRVFLDVRRVAADRD